MRTLFEIMCGVPSILKEDWPPEKAGIVKKLIPPPTKPTNLNGSNFTVDDQEFAVRAAFKNWELLRRSSRSPQFFLSSLVKCLICMLCVLLAVGACFDMTRVVGDIYDSLEVIENLTTPPRARHISEANLTSRPLADDEYPSPLSPKDTSLQSEWQKECTGMQDLSARTDMTLENLYWHPAGAAQFGGTQEEIDAAQRVKVRLTIDTKIGWLHFLGIYAPPGEVITVEVPDQLAGFEIRWNVMAVDYCNNGQRLPDLKSHKYTLHSGTNTIGMPLGGCITWEITVDAASEPVDVYISGGILAPWFRYGVDTDEDWTTRIRHYPGLVACFDTGNLFMLIPAFKVRQYTNVSLPMEYYRACCEIMDSTARRATNNPAGWGPAWYVRRDNGRQTESNRWYFDCYVGIGQAYGAYGSNYCVLPYSGYGEFCSLTFDETTWLWNSWGTLHELGHHHQTGWRFPDDEVGEVTNNVLLMICYSYYSAVTLNRGVNADGGMWITETGGGWCFLTHGYVNIDNTDRLHQWLSILHAFGQTKFREFIHTYIHGDGDPQGTYGLHPAFAVVGAQVFGVDLRPHLRFIGIDIDDTEKYPNQKFAEVLNSMDLKPWYPVINAYQTGYEVNGEVFETARPWRVPYGRTSRFDFKTYTKQRSGQGVFEIKELIPGRGHWEKIEDGVYDYTPPEDPRIEDEWRLVYYETTTNQTTISYGKIKFTVRGNEFKRFTGITATGNSVLDAYQKTKGLTPAATGTGSGIQIADHSENKYVTVCKGSLIAPKTGNYTFYAAPDERALFYLSRRPLAGDPDIDRKYLTLTDNTNWHGYDKQYPSDWHMLTEGKQYYFCFVIYNTDGVGGGKIGYIVNSTGDIVDFPSDKVVFENVDATIADGVDDGWMPESFEELQGLDSYYGSLNDKPIIKSATAPVEQEGRPVTNLIDDIKGDNNNIYVTRWNTANGEPVIAEYPQEYEFELQTMSSFDIIWLRRCQESRRVITSNLTVKCDNEVVYSGPYDSHCEGAGDDWKVPTSGMLICSTIQMSFSDNSAQWDGLDLVPGVCLQEVHLDTWFGPDRVLPISHPYFVFTNNWTKVRGGAYYNGFGMYGSKGATLEFKLKASVSEFVIIGDKRVGELGSNIASVWINGKHSGNIMPNVKSSSYPRLYKKPLFVMRHMEMTEDFTVTVQVESGEIGIAGLLLNKEQLQDALVPLSVESKAKIASQQ